MIILTAQSYDSIQLKDLTLKHVIVAKHLTKKNKVVVIRKNDKFGLLNLDSPLMHSKNVPDFTAISRAVEYLLAEGYKVEAFNNWEKAEIWLK